MTRRISSLSGLAVLNLLFWSLSFGGSSGCSGSDVTQTATAEDAEESTDVMTLVVTQAINQITIDSGALSLSGLVASSFKPQITATSSSSCDSEDVPSLASNADTTSLSGGDFSCGSLVGSGSCTVRSEDGDTADSLRGVIDCNTLVVPTQGAGAGDGCENVGVDGRIGFEVDISNSATTVTYNITTISAEDLTLSLNSGNVCSVTSDLANVIVVDSTSGEGSSSASGCLSVCGETFNVSGTDDL